MDCRREIAAFIWRYPMISSNGPSQVKLVSNYTQRVLGKPIAVSPTILFDQDDKPSGWLIYAYSPKLSTAKLPNLGTPTYMVGRRISFEKKN